MAAADAAGVATAVGSVASVLRSLLGPQGARKAVVQPGSQHRGAVVSNDGATVLRALPLQHPAALLLAELASAQDTCVGDGTTTAVLLACEVYLACQRDLITRAGMHVTEVTEALRCLASDVDAFLATSTLRRRSNHRDARDHRISIAATALQSKVAACTDASALAADLYSIAAELADANVVDVPRAVSYTATAVQPQDSSPHPWSWWRGCVVPAQLVHQHHRNDAEHATRCCVAAVSAVFSHTEISVGIATPLHIGALLYRIATLGVDVVLLSRSLRADAIAVLAVAAAAAGITVVCSVPDSSLELVMSAAPTLSCVPALRDVAQQDCFTFERVAVLPVLASDDVTAADGSNHRDVLLALHLPAHACTHVTFALASSSTVAAAELQRSIHDAMCVLHRDTAGAHDGCFPGGGAVEAAVSAFLLHAALQQRDERQFVYEAVADAFAQLPATLASNAGHRGPVVAQRLLQRAKAVLAQQDSEQNQEHGATEQVQWPGLELVTGTCVAAWSLPLVEPCAVKQRAICFAIDTAVLLLRLGTVVVEDESDSDRLRHKHDRRG